MLASSNDTKRQQSWKTFNSGKRELILPSITELLHSDIYQQPGRDPVHKVIAASLAQDWRLTQNDNVKPVYMDVNSLWRDLHENLYCRAIFQQIGVYVTDTTTPSFAPWLIRLYLEIRRQAFERAQGSSKHCQQSQGVLRNPCTEQELIAAILRVLPPTHFVPTFVHGLQVLDALYRSDFRIMDLLLDSGVDEGSAKYPAIHSLGDRLSRSINSRHSLYCTTHPTAVPVALVEDTHHVYDGVLQDTKHQLRDAVHEAMARAHMGVPALAVDTRSFLLGLMAQSRICYNMFSFLRLHEIVEAGPQHKGYPSVRNWVQSLIHSYLGFLKGRPPTPAYQLPCCPLLVLELSETPSDSRQLIIPPALLGAPKPVSMVVTDSSDTPPANEPGSSATHHGSSPASIGNVGSKFFQGVQDMTMTSPQPQHGSHKDTSSQAAPRHAQWQLPTTDSNPRPTSKRSQKTAAHDTRRTEQDLCAPHDSLRDLSKLHAARAHEVQTQQLTQIHIPMLHPDTTILADSASQLNDIMLPPLRIEVYVSALLKDIASKSVNPMSAISTIVGQHASARVTFTHEITCAQDINPSRQTSDTVFAWIQWAAALLGDQQPGGTLSCLQSIFLTAHTGWNADVLREATQLCNDALQRLRSHSIYADGQQVAYVALNEGILLEQHLQAFLQCLTRNNNVDPWLGQLPGSPLGVKGILYGTGAQLDMLRIFLTAFADAPVHLAYKARYGERLVLLPLASTRQAGDDLLYGHRADLMLPNHCTLADVTRMQGHLLVYESLDSVYLHNQSSLHASRFYALLQESLAYVLQATQYQQPPALLASPHITSLAAQLPDHFNWDISMDGFMAAISTLPYVCQVSASAQLDPITWVGNLSNNNHDDLRRSIHYAYVQALLITEHGPSATWISGYNMPQSYGSLQGVGQHLELSLDPNLYLGTAVLTDQVGINPTTGEPNIYLRMYRHASTASTAMLLQPGSALLAANVIRHFLGTGDERLTNNNMGLPSATPTLASRRALTDTVNLLLQRNAVTPEIHEHILTSLNATGNSLPHIGSNYQQQVQHLFDFYLALMSSARQRKLGGLNAVVLLTLNTPGCTAPTVLAVTHLDGSTNAVKTEILPLTTEATSRPHAKLLDISATFTLEGAFAVKVTYDNIRMAAPPMAKETPVFPKSEVSSLHLPPPPEPTPATPSLPLQADSMAVATPTIVPPHGHTVFIVPHQAPKTVHAVMISGIRHSLDPTLPDTQPTSLLSQLCNGLMAAGYYPYLPQEDGSPVEGIRNALLEARSTHQLHNDPNTFHSYEILLPLTTPLMVGGTTARPNLLTWCHNSKVPWERTPYTLQGLTQQEAGLYARRWEMLVTREGIPGESNCDAYGRDTFHEIMQSLLPPDEPLLTLVQWVGGMHYRKLPKGKGRVQTSGPILVAYFNPQCLPGVLDNITRAVQSARKATGPQWISLQKNQFGSYSVTDQLLSLRNPALCAYREYTFDIYTSSAISNFPVAPHGAACHVQPNIFYAIIKVPSHLSATELLDYFGQPGALPPEFITLRNWPQHPHFGDGVSVMLNALPNRTCHCILAVLNKVPALNRLAYKDGTLYQTVHLVHPAREADRYHTTLGSLLHTVETTQTDSLLPSEMLIKYGLASSSRKGHASATTTRSSGAEPTRTYRQAVSTADDSSGHSSVVARDSHTDTPSTVSSQSTTMVTTDHFNVRELMMQQNSRIDKLTELVSMLITNQLGNTGGATASPPPPPGSK